MDFGVLMFPTEYAIAPDELARALEERGFESVWFPEHTHIPASRRSPWPGGGDLPRDYWSCYDPFVALMAAAGATRRLKLGTGICLVVERDPIVTAKEVATLDRLSGGRLDVGLGQGWLPEEFVATGVPTSRRGQGFEDHLAAMRACWGPDPVKFESADHHIPRSTVGPKPVRGADLPVLIGAVARPAVERAARVGAGFVTAFTGVTEAGAGETSAAGAGFRASAGLGAVRPMSVSNAFISMLRIGSVSMRIS